MISHLCFGAYLLVVIRAASAQCVYTPTKCQCKREISGNVCLHYSSETMEGTLCQTYECGAGYVCHCSGHEICDIGPCEGNPISYQAVNTVLESVDQIVQCTPVPKAHCLKPKTPSTCVTFPSPVINEFRPNPPSVDPRTMIIELRGTPGQLFSGYITSLENDGVTSNGLINDVASASGTFDDKGILIFDVQDLDNPSFTVVLSSQKPGNREDRMAVNNEGQLVHPGMFGTIFDAIGVPDSVSDESRLFGAQLGGVNLRFIGNEPTLVFRDSCTGDWYAVDRINDTPTHVFDANGLMLNIDEFNSVDVLHPTFGSSNPTRHLDMMTGGRFSLMSSQ